MPDDALAAWKRSILADALAYHGVEAEIAPTVTVPPASRRRARFTLQRTKKTALFGFRAAGEHRVVDMRTCTVLHPAILAALPDLKAIALAGASRKRAVTVQATHTDSGLDVVAEEMKPLDLPLRETLAKLAEQADVARLSWNGETIAERRPPALSFGPATLHPPPGTFLQATREAEKLILDLLAEAAKGARVVADLFCGCGTFALPLAASAPVAAFDSEKPAIAALQKAARACPGPHPVTAQARDLFRAPLQADELAPFDAVILDPPRAGAKAQTAQLAISTVPVVAMVSCNPATFARDAKALMEGGYRPGRILPIDQFRWSPHTEVVGIFRRP
jgi:23S rRNA (uracil1939-C5)-methyltransferase